MKITETSHFGRDYDKLAGEAQGEIIQAIQLYVKSPHDPDPSLKVQKVSNERIQRKYGNVWKLRAGKYRVIFTKTNKEISFLLVGHRKDIYERMSRAL